MKKLAPDWNGSQHKAHFATESQLPACFKYPRQFTRAVELGILDPDHWQLQEGKSLHVRLDGLVKTLPGWELVLAFWFELLHEPASAGPTVWRGSVSTRQSSFNAGSCSSMELTF